MSIDKVKLKQIAEKAKALETTGNLGLAKEFIDIEDNMTNIQEKIGEISTKIDEPIEVNLIIE